MAASGLKFCIIVKRVASSILMPGLGPPTSGRKGVKSLPSSRVTPTTVGTFRYRPAAIAAIGSVGSTAPSGIGPEPVRPLASTVLRIVLASLARR